MKACDKNIQSAIKLSKQMIELATKGYSECRDTGCMILYGVILDSAYKMKKIAENEKKLHQR
ncbi:MAG: hypothetical protein ABIK15_01820 [Pseudomonadota bacterium]|nr:MAG: hypothetical protein C4522_12040 [Desulfobacteraceae bacterium]